MARGDVVAVEYQQTTDPHTGVEVTRVTDDAGDTHFPYFTQTVFDEPSGMLLLSSNRTGAWQVYGLEIGSGKLVQLTDEPEGIAHHQSTFLPTRSAVAYFAGQELKLVTLDTLQTTAIWRCPDGFSPSILSATSDGSSVTFAYREAVQVSTQTQVIYSGFQETFFRCPSCVVMRVMTDGSGARALWGERKWISHVNVSPVDPNIVVFCHEGPWHMVQRLWVVRADTYEVYSLLPQRRLLDRSGHEYFTRSGRVVTQWASRQSVRSTDWVHANILVWPDGTDAKTFRYQWGAPGHIQTNAAENLHVGDACRLGPELPDGQSFMCLIRHEGERAIVQPLCRHDTSWKTQHSHPHPVFSPDDRWVYFNSDRGGRTNVYRAPAVWRG